MVGVLFSLIIVKSDISRTMVLDLVALLDAGENYNENDRSQ